MASRPSVRGGGASHVLVVSVHFLGARAEGSREAS
jgi:hypothetical protein